MTEEEIFVRRFCARTRALRRAAGMSRGGLARSLGIAPATYAKYETRRPLPPHLVGPFTELVGCTIDDLYQPDLDAPLLPSAKIPAQLH